MYWKRCNYNMLDQVETLQPGGAWSGQIRGENSEYVFVLVRNNETKPWVIQEVNKKIKKSRDIWDGFKRNAPGLLLYAPGPVGMPELVQSSGFKPVEVIREPGTEEDLVRLTFTYSPKDPEAERLRGGVVVLDPSREWTIRRGEVELAHDAPTKSMWKYAIQYEHKEGVNHHAIPVKSDIKGTVWENEQITFETETKCVGDLHEREIIPEQEFTLSAYGLPEPTWAQRKPTRWYLWLGLVGILCVILGAAMAWYRKRQSARMA
jgi:hypothetical protein